MEAGTKSKSWRRTIELDAGRRRRGELGKGGEGGWGMAVLHGTPGLWYLYLRGRLHCFQIVCLNEMRGGLATLPLCQGPRQQWYDVAAGRQFTRRYPGVALTLFADYIPNRDAQWPHHFESFALAREQ